MDNKKKKQNKETRTEMMIAKIAGGLVPTPMSAANQAKFGRKIIKD